VPDIRLWINGNEMLVKSGTTVAAAMLQANAPCRISVSGEPRTALCGMGICFECRAVVDGVAHRPACQMLCADGMTVETAR
jgi:predicted molibdopterin-dependent oxidoreductase YjgC